MDEVFGLEMKKMEEKRTLCGSCLCLGSKFSNGCIKRINVTRNKITSIIYYSKWNSYSAKDYVKIIYIIDVV